MSLTFYQIDAFANNVFEGNPAAICLLDEWLETDLMQNIAMENNLAETAYLVSEEYNGAGHYHLRWFTPGMEVDLCGHATLASAHALWTHFGEESPTLTFHTRSGALVVTRNDQDLIEMDFPTNPIKSTSDTATFEKILGITPQACFLAGEYAFAVLGSEAEVRAIEYNKIDFAAAEKGDLRAALIATAKADPGSEVDCVSRFFAPYAGIPEDPVTGSIHTSIVPYWAEQLGKKDITAFQASPRGGTLFCTDEGERVVLRGRCADYMKAEINL